MAEVSKPATAAKYIWLCCCASELRRSTLLPPCRYIKWTQEQFAAQGGKAELQQVLETATKSLSSTSRYNNDVRLLRIWVQYVSTSPVATPAYDETEVHPGVLPLIPTLRVCHSYCQHTSTSGIGVTQSASLISSTYIDYLFVHTCRLTACQIQVMCSCTLRAMTSAVIMPCCMRHMQLTWSSKATFSRLDLFTRRVSTGRCMQCHIRPAPAAGTNIH